MIRRAVIHVREYEKRAETYPSNWITGDSEILVRKFQRLVGAIILRISGAKERPSEKGRCTFWVGGVDPQGRFSTVGYHQVYL